MFYLTFFILWIIRFFFDILRYDLVFIDFSFLSLENNCCINSHRYIHVEIDFRLKNHTISKVDKYLLKQILLIIAWLSIYIWNFI
jgi:hypothetical protein